ncbi:hypothetical protein Ddye_025811 [Dipteronia dyeriana]|uniref:Ubiquitin-like protease family profile domain-containing protein n=1 Tax=Dipteronia dyeriana TaxID=168575 RepID=A0AAD9TLJ4_9ROSI|nr:hypothetical protein Ddye_025811 [Dipteronia dyeriana]
MDLSKVHEDSHKTNTSKCHTINIFGFPLPFQMTLFDWEVHDYEKGTDYYMSLVKLVHFEFEEEHNVGFDEVPDDRLTVRLNELDEGTGSFHNYHTTSLIRSKTSLSNPNSKRTLFNEGGFETPNNSVMSTIPKLYLVLAKLIKDNELANAKNIQDKLKLQILEEKRRFEKSQQNNLHLKNQEQPKKLFMDMDGSKQNDDNVFAMDTDGHHVETIFEREMEKNNMSYAVHLEKDEGHANEFSNNADGDTDIVHAKVGDTFNPAVLSKKANPKNLGLDKFVKHLLSMDDYPSPTTNVVIPNPNMSVVALDGPDPNVVYKDVDKLLIPNFSSEHWMLCDVHLKKGLVELSDSKWSDHHDHTYRLKDICCLLYLLPFILKHSGYYEELNMPHSSTPFHTVNFNKEIIPQQDDGDSCSVFMLKYAELLFTVIPMPWILEFGQKDIPSIRRLMALDLFTNGQFCNSP